MSSNDITYDEPKEGTIDGVKKVIGCNVGTFSIGMQHSLKMKGQWQVLLTVMDEWRRVTSFEVSRLVKLFSLADEVFAFFLED